MMDCCLCGPNDLSGEYHPACKVEWDRRANNNTCTKCGTKPATNNYWCGSCTPESPFLGYPGGS